jgi:regulator of sigma E protease
MLITIVAFLAVLILLVVAHECGHFFTARATGVKVEEFGIGFPPRVFSIKRHETRYSINAIPLGGFVKLAGEEDPNVPGSLAGKSTWVRILVLASGAVMNAILPILLFSIAAMIPHNVLSGQVVAANVTAGSPAAQAGIKAGDTIISINRSPIGNIGDLQRMIQVNLGHEVDILVKHSDTTTETVWVTPRWRAPSDQGATGIEVRLVNSTVVRQSYPFWKAIPMGAGKCIQTYILFKNVIISMIIGATPAVVAGPVGIAQITGEAARAGLSYLLEFAAFFSINLAIVNIFPLPALDGGRIAFVLLEWLRRGKRVSPKVEGMVHYVGFIMLLAVMVLVTYQDIIRIIMGESLIP